MNCDFCLSEPGLLLVSNQENGDTQSIGANCMPLFLTEMSKTWGAWPDLDELATPEWVEAKAKALGIWPSPATSTVQKSGDTPGDRTKPVRKRAAKAAPAKAVKASAPEPEPRALTGVQERVDARRATMEPPNYDEIPYDLLSAEEKAARDAAANGTAEVASGGQ